MVLKLVYVWGVVCATDRQMWYSVHGVYIYGQLVLNIYGELRAVL